MNHRDFSDDSHFWPALPLKDWAATRDTLHMWTQIVGKVRLALSPQINHWWEVPLYVSSRGLTTSAIPYERGVFEMEFNFLSHQLVITTSEGQEKEVALAPRSVANFYQEFMGTLASLEIKAKIWTMPVEVPNPIPFEKDEQHASYDAQQAKTFWRVLLVVDEVFKQFRGRFLGKNSPVHFFWGSFDLAVTRFSGRRAPDRPSADAITREAYSHEVISAGWWPGGGPVNDAAFYAYAAPEPEGFDKGPVRPGSAFYDENLHEYILMYEDAREASSPKQAVMDFLQSTYEAGATRGNWNREELERGPS